MTASLVAVDELVDRIGDPDMAVVDCRWWLEDPDRGYREYLAGHIPTAVFASLDDDLTAPTGPGRHPLPTPRAFADRMSDLGIGPGRHVVAYDDRGGVFAARAWWMLSALGVAAALLDGGLQAWQHADLPVTDEMPTPAPVDWPETLPDRFPGTVERAELRRRRSEMVLVDARARERYRGEVEPIDPIAGHIPGAINVPYAGNLTTDLRMRSAVDLRARFVAAGVATGDRTVVYCGSGVTSCHHVLAMELAGLGRPFLYPGSWSDWCTSGEPVETSC